MALDVVDIGFVFHMDTVANLSFDCYGVRNGFVCRFWYQQEREQREVVLYLRHSLVKRTLNLVESEF